MRQNSSRGFTLLELMVTVSLVAILLMVAAPGFESALNGSRLSSSANTVTAALQLARGEAVRRNARVVVCSTTDMTSCTGAAGDWSAWLVFVDANASGARDAAEEIVQTGTIDAPLVLKPSAALAALNNQITFRPDGLARASNNISLLAGTLAVCVQTTQPAENVRDVSLAFGGRTAVRKRNGAGACATPADT